MALAVTACTSSTDTGSGATGRGEASPVIRDLSTATSAPGHPRVDPNRPTTPASFTVTPGVEQVTVTGAPPKARLTLVDRDGGRLLTLVSDEDGQAVFSYVPDDWFVAQSGTGQAPPTSKGTALRPGDGYTVRNESAEPVEVSPTFRVLARDDHPPTSLYDGQELKGVHWRITGGPVPGEDAADGFQYIEVRDGVKLSAMVRFPDPALYGDGPYPTVIEYSGYGPSNPGSPEPGTMIATAMGFATVAVNMRGTGCSGGVFDVFNPAQQADGYDIVETVARQPWVLHHKVGMIGLSYSGISQLFVASTRPPSLAAITPLSVIEDPWKMQWPGGIYNAGFTRQWLAERDRQSAPGGSSWVTKRIEGGDTTCAAHQVLRKQNIDFESFTKALEFRPADADARDLSLLVRDIETPVYLTGAWQDEQTGPRFATMLANFTSTDKKHFVLFNGHHPDGYAPYNLSRWYEFLQLYVAKKVPRMPSIVRAGAPALFEDNFGVKGLEFEPDRFADLTDDQYDEALARWESDPTVRVLFEWGAGRADAPGAPLPRWEQGFDSWPPTGVQPWTLYLGPDGSLTREAPSAESVDTYQFDAEAGPIGYASAGAYDFIKPTVKIDWQQTPEGKGLSYLTEPLADDTTIAGPGYVDLWFRSDAPDAGIEVVLSEVRPDGIEVRIQNGLLRAGSRKVDAARSDALLIQETFAEADYEPLPPGEFVEVKVPIFPVAHVLRAGSRLRLQINTPGRDLPLWFFENPDFGKPDAWHDVSIGGTKASAVVLPVLPAGTVRPAPGYPPCPSLRGQPCRAYVPLANKRQ
jgi:hypothetical protein